MDKIETKIDKIVPHQPSKLKTEKPLVKFHDPESSPILKLKPTIQKIEEMLNQLTPEKGEKSGHKVLDSVINPSESESDDSIETESSNISKIENTFKNVELDNELKVKRLTGRINPTSLTKNWYPRNMQEILNKLQHMSMVANSYVNNHSFR